MKKPSLAAFGLAIVAVLGLRGLHRSPAVDLTAVPTWSPTSSQTITPASIALPSTTEPTQTPVATSTPPNPTGTITSTAAAQPTSSDATPTLTRTSSVASASGARAVPRYTLSLDAKSLAIDTLRARSYGSGPIKITRVVSSDEAFKRVLFEYPSDGLRITGMMSIPRGVGPFPVVILDHGYFNPSEYNSGDGTIRAADNFARGGYLTLAPDYRCYAGSQCGPNPLYVGYAIDVLNLIASLPSLSYADTSRIGIWGHSMGGGITIRVLTISSQIKVASLYGALNSDDEVHYCWLYGCRTPVAPTRLPRTVQQRLQEFDPNFLPGYQTPSAAATPADPMAKLHEIFLQSSPSRHLNYINAPIIIHHGEDDDTVPIEWSVDLAERLNAMGKSASLYTYPGQGHVFQGWSWQLFMARTLSFFNEYLNPRATPITVEMRVLRQERMLMDLSY